MSTASDLINLALRDIGVMDESETPSAYLAADALSTLNQMLAQWKISKMLVYAQTETSFTPSGAKSYTIGVGGDVPIPRPNAINYIFLRNSDLDYPIRILNSFEEYQSIGLKTIKTFPSYAYYNPSFPQGVLYLYPQAQASDGKIYLVVSADFPILSSQASSLSFPDEYNLAIRLSLAELLATMMGMDLKLSLTSNAAKARRMIKRNNLRIKPLDSGDSSLPGWTRIVRGY